MFCNCQGTILFMLKKRIQNQHGYQKRKIKGKRQATNEDKNISEAELEELSALLLKEVKAKKPNKEAIREIQVATFPSRSSHIDQLDKTVLSEISSSYPFFAIHECTVSFNNDCKINRRKMSFTVFNAILTFYPLEYWIDTCTLHVWHKSLHPCHGLRMWSLWNKGICNWPWLQEVSKWITYTITRC